MASTRFKRRAAAALLLIVLLAGGGTYFLYTQKEAPANTEEKSHTPAAQKPDDSQTVKDGMVRTPNFTYPQPNGWSLLSQDALKTAVAVSGISHGNPIGAAFYVSFDSSESKPTNNAQLEDTTLNTIKNLPGFKLISSAPVTVAGQAAQQFIYVSGSPDSVKNQLTAFIYGEKIYLLLFTSAGDKFETYQQDFKTIIDGFAFS